MEYRKINDEVLYPEGKFVGLKTADLAFLKTQAAANPRKTVRICAHQGPQDKVHEMFIVHSKDTYVRPHRHLNKAESLFLIEGEADAVFFDDDGKIVRTIEMGAAGSGRQFYYRLCEPVYHTLIIRTETIVFFEVTSGPFKAKDTQFASWAPDGRDASLAKQYMKKIQTPGTHHTPKGRIA